MKLFLKKTSYLVLILILILSSLPFLFIKNTNAQQNIIDNNLNPSLELLGAGARWAARQGNSVLYVNWKDNYLAHHLTDGIDWYFEAWTKYMDDFRTSITKALKHENFDITYTGDIPEDLSNYDLVLIHAWFAVEPHHVPIIRDYIENGGAVVILNGVPCYFSVYCKDNWPYRQGGTDLTSIKDWFGAGEYWNTGGSASLVVDQPFNTSLSKEDVIFSINGSSSSFIHSLSDDSKVIAQWNSKNVNGFPFYYDNQVFAFTHKYGEGRVYYQAHFEMETNEEIPGDKTSEIPETELQQTANNESEIESNSVPVIDSVSPILTDQMQTITITGSGFGNIQPHTSSLGDGSVNTIDEGDTPSLQFRNEAKEGGWTAGFEDSTDRNGIGIFLESWSDKTIVLGGFGGAFSINGMWNLEPGDHIRILVKVAGKIASFSTIVEGSQPDTGNETGPIVSSVSPISTDRLQTIVIDGSGFGDIQPELMDLEDGSVNTVGGGDTPIIRIYNDGWKGWMAGVRDSPRTAWCLIGIILESWTDNQIILGGFGKALTSYDQYSLNVEDPMRVVIETSGGRTEYKTTAIEGSNITNEPDSTLPLPKPILSVSCQSSTSFSDFRAKINGNLTYNGTGLVNLPILISYSVDGGKSWNLLTLVNTDNNGDFNAVWLLFVTGNYVLKAEWEGNSNYAKTSTEINFSVTSSDEQNIISVMSNSTISAFTFNSTDGQLTFSVTGPSGTSGQTYAYIPKSLIPDINNLQILMDENPIEFDSESKEDSWLVTLTYNHSTHEITMNLNEMLPAQRTLVINHLEQWVTYIAITILSLTVTILLIKLKTKKNQN